ncbi:MAG: porin [Aquificaceae bacterium]|nr:porin [Aquificaceae bacterium]MDW8237243.1 hypothetical protein [Aquificaceae bacterium]
MGKILIFFAILGLAFSKEGAENLKLRPDGGMLIAHSHGHSHDKKSSLLPEISLVIDFSLVSRNRKDDEYKELQIPRVFHRHHDGHSHGIRNEKRGFNLNHVELGLYAHPHKNLDLAATFSFSDDKVNVEEAYALFKNLPAGFEVKLGKFRSGFGKLNQQEPHAWDFATSPLVFMSFLGDEGLIEKGLQLSWHAPTKFYLQLGAEVLQGESENSFNYKGFTITHSPTGRTFEVEDKSAPSLFVGFIKSSFEYGDLTLSPGVSYAQGKHRHDHGDHGLSADSKLYGIDLTAKYSFDKDRYLSLQGEYIYREMSGTRYGFDRAGNVTMDPIKRRQGGYYIQLVAGITKQLRAGVQYNLINKNEVYRSGARLLPAYSNLPAYYAMAEYSPNSFSRVRLQAGQNKALYERVAGSFEKKSVNEFILQFTFAFGHHNHKH